MILRDLIEPKEKYKAFLEYVVTVSCNDYIIYILLTASTTCKTISNMVDTSTSL